MKMSEVIKHGGDGDTDPGRVSEGQEVHMGPRPAWSDIILLPSYVPHVPRLHGTQIWLDWPAGHREEVRDWVKLAPRRVGGRSEMKGEWGVDWAQASPVAPVPLPGSLPWQSGHAAWSKHPLSGEKRKKTTAWRVGRHGEEDGGDECDRAGTVGALPGIMASRWPTEAQPWWTSAWQALALFQGATLRDQLDTTQTSSWRRPAVSGHLLAFCHVMASVFCLLFSRYFI